jgi:transposase
MGRPSKWTPEFKEEAVRLYRSGSSSIAEVARGLGINPETFRKWVKQAQIEAGEVEGSTREEKAEIAALRRRVARLEEEKQILQKAAVYFARETDRP